MLENFDATKYYIFYDGDCGFCNYWVSWILKNDHQNKFLFSALQSDFGQRFLKERNLPTKELSTLYLWKPQSFYFKKSQAVFAIARILGGKYAVFGHLNFLPVAISDAVYGVFAKNRHQLSPKQCVMPTEDQRKKFV